MSRYIDYYFDILVNLTDINDVKEILPSINLDGTNKILDILIDKLNEELNVADELGDEEYSLYLKSVIDLLKDCKVEDIEEESVFDNENIIIFGDNILKAIKKLNDSFYYIECLAAINSLKSKSWMSSNKANSENYKRLHGDAVGLSEIKMKKIRLMHRPVTPDIWFVSEILKKDGNNPKQHRELLHSLANHTKLEVERLKKMFIVDGVIDYESLINYANENNKPIIEELSRFEGRKL